jgi:hypothetical protein
MSRRIQRTLFGLLVAVGVTDAVQAGDRVAQLTASGAGARWIVEVEHAGATLSVREPGGRVERFEFDAATAPTYGLVRADGSRRPDGVYQYELVLAPALGPAARQRLRESRETGTEAPPVRRGAVESGSFAVRNGIVEVTFAEETAAPKDAGGGVVAAAGVAPADQVIPDDLIVQQSLCVGFDCVNNESFGFDTIRLKENNTRIKFEDTSASSFPSNDWQLTANDSTSGGQNKFSIEDITGAKVPFTVLAGAATNSIFVDSTGRVGFRTSTPVLDLHVATSNSPALRLEQNNSGGFTAQTWDIAGNEANFFVRDVTSGSRLPFRIRPGAPTSSIDIDAAGEVGIGTAAPSEALHVNGTDGDTTLLVKEANATVSARELLRLENNGGVQVNYVDLATPSTWGANNVSGNFRLTKVGSGVIAFDLQGNGNLTIAGTLTQNSDRNSKTNITAVAADEILAKVASLDLFGWTYKGDDPAVRHFGPMAQDFAALFGLGGDERRIAPLDVAGVGLAAIQALHKNLSAREAELAALRQQNEALAARLARLEALLGNGAN